MAEINVLAARFDDHVIESDQRWKIAQKNIDLLETHDKLFTEMMVHIIWIKRIVLVIGMVAMPQLYEIIKIWITK